MENTKERIQALATAQDSINTAIANELEGSDLAPNTADDISARYWLMNLLEPLSRKELKSIVDGFLVPMLNDEQAKKIVKFLLVRFPHYYKEITEPQPTTPVAPQNQPQQVEVPKEATASTATSDIKEILSGDTKYQYMLLGRMQMDCKYYISNKDKVNDLEGISKHLWAGTPEKQIEYMKAIWNNLEEKPEWLSMEDIEKFEKEMA